MYLPRISNFHNSSGRSVCGFFEDFGLCKYQQPEPAEGGGVECGVWLMGSKGSGKQAVQSFIYIEWKVGWIGFPSISNKNFYKKKSNHPPQFYFGIYFSKCPPGDSQVTDLWIFQLEVTNDALLKWVTFLPQGRPPGEDFHCQVMPNVWRVRVPVRSPGLVTTSDQPNPPNRLGWEFLPFFGI